MDCRRIYAFAVGGLLLAQSTGLATDLVVDDFDDPVLISLPAPATDRFVIQSDIGPLRATKQTRVVDFGAWIEGSVRTVASQVALQSVGTSSPPSSSRTFRLELTYEFDQPIDATLGGRQTALAIDFGSLATSTGVLDSLSVNFLNRGGHGGRLISVADDLPASQESFTYILPLDVFARGEYSVVDLFDQVNRLDLGFTPLPGGAFDDTPSFDLRIDRVRLIVIPEPSGGAILISAALVFSFSRRKEDVSQTVRR